MQIDGICLNLGFSFPALYKSSLVRYDVIDEEVWKFTYLSKIWQWMFWVKWKSLTYHNLCIILTFCGRGNFGSQLGKSWTICKWLQDLLISNLIGQCHSKHKSNVYRPITFLEIRRPRTQHTCTVLLDRVECLDCTESKNDPGCWFTK